MSDGENLAGTESEARDILHAARCVADLKLRANLVADRILSLPDENVAPVIECIHALAGEGDADAKDAWSILANPEVFSLRLDPFRRSRIYHHAARNAMKAVPALLSRGRAAREYNGGEQAFLVHGLSGKTLGERLSRARETDAGTREKASFDMSPKVLAHLLENPRTTERDVMRIAARRPIDPRVLEAILRDPRWFSRYLVRLAVSRNPYTPANQAANILPSLLLKDLLEIRDDRSLHESVRAAATDLVRQKRQQKAAELRKIVR